MEFPTVSLVDVASYLPENRVPTEYFTQFSRSERMAKNVMFRSPSYRHHVARDETAVDMVERAVAPLIERHGRDTIGNVDVLLTHVQLPDNPVLGSGPEVARRLGLRPDWVIDVHNGGCASFPHMMALAQKILQTTDAKTAMIAAVQNAAGPSMTQSEIRKLAFAPVPGDGCGVGLLVKNEDAPILGVVGRTYPEFAGDMTFEAVGLPKDAVPRKYWEPGIGQPTIGFTESKIAKVFTRGNRLVPEVGYAVLEEIDAKPGDVDVFVSNQPNRLFLRNWHDALQIPGGKHPDTFDECGNLFGAGIPVTLDTENRAGRIANGSLVLMSAFAHAGDYAGAAAVRWGAKPA
ncbi:MAG TPA: 3-oxoacyl-[acyl-carrier-protein] synthase III C-terminal domain-containing protein [Aldersonia sp.]